MSRTKRELESALPFAMEPVVYDFAINETATWADLLTGGDALLPPHYYALFVPRLLKLDLHALPPLRRAELDKFAAASRNQPELGGVVQDVFDRLLPHCNGRVAADRAWRRCWKKMDLTASSTSKSAPISRTAALGWRKTACRPAPTIEDVQAGDVIDATAACRDISPLGRQALADGEVAVVTLAAGVGSRWTQGAGVVKALHPFCKLAGRHRTFMEVAPGQEPAHGSRSRDSLPHIFTTSYLTHAPTEDFLARQNHYGYPARCSSRPAGLGLRMIPTVRDLRFVWEEMPQQILDEQEQKVRDSLRDALISWASSAGEGSDYTDNLPRNACTPSATGTRCPTCCATACWRGCWRSARS